MGKPLTWYNQFSSVAQSCPTLCDPMDYSMPRLPYPSPTLGAYSSSCPSTWWCHPTISSCLPLLCLPSIFPNIRVFSNGSVLPIRWANNWSFSFKFSLSSEYTVLIFFRMDSFDLLAVQGTFKSLLQHHSSKGIHVCHLSVMSYFPCWDLTTRTEFKQHAKMRIKSQCPI